MVGGKRWAAKRRCGLWRFASCLELVQFAVLPFRVTQEGFRGETDAGHALGEIESVSQRLAELIEQRLVLVPRYRQKVKNVPAHLARPVWVDDQDFDIGYHVRRSALPKPGSDEQLRFWIGSGHRLDIIDLR